MEYGNFSNSYKFDLGTDGVGYDAILSPYGGTINQLTKNCLDVKECASGRKRHGLQTRMKGMYAFAFGITTAPRKI